jgi:light-regulated signal transduction histidine kinase (bacteriophytochrome)
VATLRAKHAVANTITIAEGEEDVRRLNARLQLSNKLLATANADLEAFAHSVAHDLRSPIRQIAGFSRILVEDFAPQLPADARRYIDKIIQGAQHMGVLIDSLLHLAQVGRQPLCLESTPLNMLVDSALQAVQPDCEGRVIEWRLDPLSSVQCDRSLMLQVFINLIGNAVKYSRTVSPALIHVGQIALHDEQIIFVRDNGVGFDMRYADKLFGVFHRLHAGSEFEGAGIGLATVERIIRKHGGHVWAEAQPDQGATFYFTVAASSV